VSLYRHLTASVISVNTGLGPAIAASTARSISDGKPDAVKSVLRHKNLRFFDERQRAASTGSAGRIQASGLPGNP
jgi:hypothetical protein